MIVRQGRGRPGRLTVGVRLLLINALLLAALLVVGWIAWRAIDAQRRVTDDFSRISRAARYHQDLEVQNAALETIVYAALASLGSTHESREQVEASLEENLREARGDLREFERYELPPEVTDSVSAVSERVEDYQQRARDGIHAALLGRTTPDAVRQDVSVASASVKEAMNGQKALLGRHLAAANDAAELASDQAKRWLLSAAVLVCFLVCTLVALLSASIRRSLRAVRDVAQAFAAGDLTARAQIRARDEVGELARAINQLADNLTGMMERVRAEADRDAFTTQLVEGLEMADGEPGACEIISRVMGNIAPGMPMELLLADSSRAHLERAATHATAGAPGCAVESPYQCAAVRRGAAVSFADSESVNACPRLRGRAEGSLAAMCVPLTFMGRSLGVIHAARAEGGLPSPLQATQLTTLAAQAGARIGTLRAFQRTQLQAATDSLTGLNNRRSLEDAVRTLTNQQAPYAVVLCDLDHFKQLNDKHGHETGDAALRLFATAMRRALRSGDIAARWGGEEFAVVLPNGTARQAADVAERVRQCLAESLVAGQGPPFTASFGVSDSSMSASFDQLVRIADDALYQAKDAGRDRVHVAGLPVLTGSVPRRDVDHPASVDLPRLAAAAHA